MVATKDIFVAKMIENTFRWYTDHVILHEVPSAADHYEWSEVLAILEFSSFSTTFSSFSTWSGNENVKETRKLENFVFSLHYLEIINSLLIK